MTPLLLLAATALGAGSGFALQRASGWAPGPHRVAVLALMLPWFAEHASLARLARSASLNPIRLDASTTVLLADWLAPAVMVALLAAFLTGASRFRAASVGLPLLGEVLLWWVTVPLYQRGTLRGWFFVTEGLSGPWPLVYHVAAAAFLAGWALPSAGHRAAPDGAASD